MTGPLQQRPQTMKPGALRGEPKGGCVGWRAGRLLLLKHLRCVAQGCGNACWHSIAECSRLVDPSHRPRLQQHQPPPVQRWRCPWRCHARTQVHRRCPAALSDMARGGGIGLLRGGGGVHHPPTRFGTENRECCAVALARNGLPRGFMCGHTPKHCAARRWSKGQSVLQGVFRN